MHCRTCWKPGQTGLGVVIYGMRRQFVVWMHVQGHCQHVAVHCGSARECCTP